MLADRMERITAPYNFVPLSKEVVFPDWIQLRGDQAPPLHDVPFRDGICGTMEIDVTAETPVFVRGSRNKSDFFQLPGGVYAVPGTTLRGMLRNVIQVAAFSRFAAVNDHRYAVRDLQNRPLYGQYMADIVKDPKTGKGEPMPLVNAGWLKRAVDRFDGSQTYTIEVCDFAKIEYGLLQEIARERGVRGFNPGEKQTSVDKYKTWGNASLNIDTAVRWKRQDGDRRRPSNYGVASLENKTTKGTLVFTGQPSRWTPDPTGKRSGSGNAKHHDFVFLSKPAARQLAVSREIFQDFEFAHSNRGQQNKLGRSQEPNTEWAFWCNRLEKEDAPVPVFFLMDERGELKSFGLAMMFRLPYKFSIGQAVANVDPRHVLDDRLDFSDGLFGTTRHRQRGRQTRQRDGDIALKGRLGISHALEITGARPTGEVKAILGAPKASYYPNYVEQDPNRKVAQLYRTWMDKDGAPRGWKRYRVLTKTWNPEPPTGSGGKALDGDRVSTVFKPLPAGATFRAHIDVHNLRPQELGALLWALDFGGEASARHTIGLAKPLGYGRVRITLKGNRLTANSGGTVDLDQCRQAFINYMMSQVPEWDKSPQIRELLAIARPVEPSEARYQRLDPGNRVNEFIEGKKAGLSLPPASGLQTPASSQQTPRGPAQPSSSRPSSTSATPARASGRWEGRNKGAIVEIILTGKNKKDKWRCSVVNYPETVGTLAGQAPADAEVGKKFEAIVEVGNDGSALQLRWK